MRAELRNPSKYLGNELTYVQEVLCGEERSATLGTWNQRLERMFAERFGVQHAIALNSGTSALHACLMALGIGPGDEVISPALNVVMDAFAIRFQGATPVFADVCPETFTIDVEDVRRKLTPRTKAIIAVSLYGLPVDLDPIMSLAAERGITVIEDSAQCLLGIYRGRLAGSIGDLSCFSFENSKHLSVGEGGMVLTNNERLAERVRKFGGIGFKNLRADFGRIRLNQEIFQDPDYKRHDLVGYNYRLTELCAAVGVAQFERIDEIVRMRQTVAELYQDALEGCSWLVPQATPAGFTNTYWCFGVDYRGLEARGAPWRTFRRAYLDQGGDGIYAAWSLPYEEPALASIRTGDERCPVATALQPRLMQFKTNYRGLDLAREKAAALRRTIAAFD